MELNVHELRQVINLIFEHITNDLKIEKIHIEQNSNMYWDVLEPDLRKLDKSQPDLGIGDLTDDWQFLKAALADESQAVSLMFLHVAPLLRFVAEKIGQ